MRVRIPLHALPLVYITHRICNITRLYDTYTNHCPYYLQGTTHFGILSHLGKLIAQLGNFHLDTEQLDKNWDTLKEQINTLIDGNSELQTLITNLRKERAKGTTARLNGKVAGGEKIINLQDFLDPNN